jgi:hypothetical protein
MTQEADVKAQFELLYGGLRSYHETFVESSTKIAGFQILVAGWLITSRDAREALHASTMGRLIGITALVLGSFIYTLIAVRVFRYSHHIFGLMGKLGYMPSSHYETRLVKGATLAIFVCANLLLTLVTCCFAAWRS